MALTVTLAGVDITTQIDQDNFQVQQVIGTQKNTTTLFYKKFGNRSYVPAVFDTVLIQDGTSTIFGGRIVTVTETPINPAAGVVYQLDCADYSIDLDAMLVSQEYDGMTVGAIIADMLTNFAPAFTGTNVSCGFPITKIVFNQITISQAIKRLANIVQYDWYVDPDKDVHFFPKYTKLAPFNLTDLPLEALKPVINDEVHLGEAVLVRRVFEAVDLVGKASIARGDIGAPAARPVLAWMTYKPDSPIQWIIVAAEWLAFSAGVHMPSF
jgi:hypothetical protein